MLIRLVNETQTRSKRVHCCRTVDTTKKVSDIVQMYANLTQSPLVSYLMNVNSNLHRRDKLCQQAAFVLSGI